VNADASGKHYSYSVYADRATAESFDRRRFGGPIGELVAATQAHVLADFVGRVQGRAILDAGTGTGRAALLLAAGGARVTGVDASEEMLKIARGRAADQGATVRFLAGDVHRLEFPDRSFDVAVALRVLMHSPKWQLCIAELCRVADQLVILDFPSRYSTALVQSVARRLLYAFGVNTEPYQVFSEADVEKALERCGFRVRSVHRQFVLPIALHKAFGSRRFTTASEGFLDRLGLLKRLGSPVTLVAERCVVS